MEGKRFWRNLQLNEPSDRGANLNLLLDSFHQITAILHISPRHLIFLVLQTKILLGRTNVDLVFRFDNATFNHDSFSIWLLTLWNANSLSSSLSLSLSFSTMPSPTSSALEWQLIAFECVPDMTEWNSPNYCSFMNSNLSKFKIQNKNLNFI
jgi:hypothetical protein